MLIYTREKWKVNCGCQIVHKVCHHYGSYWSPHETLRKKLQMTTPKAIGKKCT